MDTNNYYFMVADDTYGSDYVYLDNSSLSDDLKYACKRSEFQFVDKSLSVIDISNDSGDALPDFIYDESNYVPLISERLKKVFDKLDIRNLYYQRITIQRRKDGLSANYWLAIPPRIDCMDLAESIINDFNQAQKIVIDKRKVGHYEIFKLSNVINNVIIVSSKIKKAIENAKCLEGFMIISDENLQ